MSKQNRRAEAPAPGVADTGHLPALPRATVALPTEIRAYRAILHDDGRCDCINGHHMSSPAGLIALCRSMLAAGADDAPMLVAFPDGSPAAFIQAISMTKEAPPKQPNPKRKQKCQPER